MICALQGSCHSSWQWSSLSAVPLSSHGGCPATWACRRHRRWLTRARTSLRGSCQRQLHHTRRRAGSGQQKWGLRAGSPPGHAEEVEQPGGPAGPLAGPCSSSPSSESMPKSSVEAAADLKLSAQPQVEAPSPQALGGLAASPSCGPRRAVTLGARASRVRLPMSLPQAPRLPTVTLAPGRGSKPITAAVSAFNVSCDFEFE
jgi:hypothetical protein